MKEAVQLWRMMQADDRDGLAQVIRWDEDERGVRYAAPQWAPDENDGWLIASFNHNREAFSRLTPGELSRPAGLCLLQMFHQYAALSDVRLYAGWDGERQRIAGSLSPSSLLNAMWTQFFFAVTEGKQYRQCRECGKWFEVSPQVNRTSRQTCSNTCRNRGYQRRQEAARAMHAQGKTFKEIAKALETEVASVKKWVASTKEK
jgi:hypothetical protein